MAVPPITFAKGTNEISLLPGMANRHGLVAGATGTGKTFVAAYIRTAGSFGTTFRIFAWSTRTGESGA